MSRDPVDVAGRPRWRGQPGRLEVHYLTATDQETGAGLWVHHEVVAPTRGDAYGHGWVAMFPAEGAPSYERFGPTPMQPQPDRAWFAAGDVTMTADSARGSTNGVRWDLRWEPGDRPLWTFPRWAWERQVLPAAQVVPSPQVFMSGTINGSRLGGVGAVAHICGHGNAHRWAWLHADLGDGDVLELVAATARRPGLRVLPRLALVQLRVGGQDWPRDPLAAAPLLRTHIGPGGFRIAGIVGTRRLAVHVDLPADRCVSLQYVDPDGATATCTNSERADVTVATSVLTPAGWREHRRWRLDATGHAEIGTRP